jgi:hypothetical protein
LGEKFMPSVAQRNRGKPKWDHSKNPARAGF